MNGKYFYGSVKIEKNLILTMEFQKIALMSELHSIIGAVNAA
jgi:hypothetical protein